MSGTKIFVVQLKELIKMAIFAVIGIALIIMLIYFFIPKEKPVDNSALYRAGTYTSELILNSGPVSVQVTVDENEITAIELKNMEEIQDVFYPLLEPTVETLSKEIITKQTLEIPVSVENQYTSQIILSAINTALAKAVIE